MCRRFHLHRPSLFLFRVTLLLFQPATCGVSWARGLSRARTLEVSLSTCAFSFAVVAFQDDLPKFESIPRLFPLRLLCKRPISFVEAERNDIQQHTVDSLLAPVSSQRGHRSPAT